jgi:hypothetical protein
MLESTSGRGGAEPGPCRNSSKRLKWRVLDHTLAEVRSKFAGMPAGKLEAMIDAAVTAARWEASAQVG